MYEIVSRWESQFYTDTMWNGFIVILLIVVGESFLHTVYYVDPILSMKASGNILCLSNY